MPNRRPYQRPTTRQRELLVALIDTGTVPKAAERLGITVAAAQSQMADARRRTGMTTERLIYFAALDGWISPQEITG